MTGSSGSRQDDFSGTKEVAEALRFDVLRLESYLASQLSGFTPPLRVSQFKGGQSNPTYLLETPGKNYVLRRKPPGKLLPSAHAVDREFRVLSALHATAFPVPGTHLLCEDESIIGTVFYVMDFMAGRIFWDPLLPGLANAERAAIYDAMNATLAKLHACKPEALGLSDFGRPGNYFARQIARWSKQYLASETERVDEMNQLIDWLPRHVPEDEDVAIVHGDYRLDNMIFRDTNTELLAVLDWELSTLGHPLADFTYHLIAWRMPLATGRGMAGADLQSLGIPSEEDYVAAYCRRTGRPGIANMDFYMAYNLFRFAAIIQGIIGRVRDGTAASEHAASYAATVRPLAEQGWSYAKAAH